MQLINVEVIQVCVACVVIIENTLSKKASFGIESMSGRGMPKITHGITALHEFLGRDYGIEEPYWGSFVSMVGL